jgi:predicted LPLAT superfamily acyltransferase/glycosyltransferase involved in cell wall biosynthesis
MSFRACAIVPCYNHGATAGAVVERLVGYGLDTLVVDDGSDATTGQALRVLAMQQSRMQLLRLEPNGGKGAAVLHGLREAAKRGFTHALQVDADGQHDLNDVPRFLQEGEGQPNAVVCGHPRFDAAAPASRRYGRWITHFWVWLETRSFAIGDSLCGFRLYPLAPTLAVANRRRLARGMNFDIDVVVRLAWEGLPIVNVPTTVTYPPGGISHFRLWRDNLRISGTHARLFVGMLWRLVFRPRRETHWSRTPERGSTLGMRLVMAAWHLLGPRAARLAALPAVLWVFATGAQARRASRAYLTRLGASSAPPTTWSVLRHMYTFAEACIDRFAAWQGVVAPVDFHGEAEFRRLSNEKRGALFIGSHLGNLEMVRALATLGELAKITAVVYTEHGRRFVDALRTASPRFAENLLEVADFGPDTAVLLKERIDRGEILVIVGDRTPATQNGRYANALFLGQAAPFPQGPMILAHLLECPVYLFFCLKRGRRYDLHLERFAERVELPPRAREETIARYVAEYAARLEYYCREAPLQWFNFYDFWHEPVR